MSKPKKTTKKKVISHRVNLTLPLHVYEFFSLLSEESGARIGTVISRFLDRTVAAGKELAKKKTFNEIGSMVGSLANPLNGRVKVPLQVVKMVKNRKKSQKRTITQK